MRRALHLEGSQSMHPCGVGGNQESKYLPHSLTSFPPSDFLPILLLSELSWKPAVTGSGAIGQPPRAPAPRGRWTGGLEG